MVGVIVFDRSTTKCVSLSDLARKDTLPPLESDALLAKEIETLNALIGDIQENISLIQQRLDDYETFLHAHNLHVCSWEDIGYDKSHGHDTSAWCPGGGVVAQLDLDVVSRHGNSPIVGRALCCAKAGEDNK